MLENLNKMKLQYNFFAYLIALLIPVGCTYDKALDAGPVIPFVSYKDEIKPIIVANCYQCHSSTSTDPKRPGYAFFDDFNELQRYALKPSTNPNFNGTKLQARIRHKESPGMPFEKSPLPEAEIVLIENWIRGGALNN